MIFDLDSNENSSDQSDMTSEGVKRKRFSLLHREPNKENRRSYEESNYDNGNGLASYLDEGTVKVEMENSEQNRTIGIKQGIKNGRGRPKKQNESHEWSDEATEALIYLWNQKEELFQKQHPYFYIREHKERAIESIRLSLTEQGHIVTSDQILSKFQSLRTYFCSQRNKMIASKKSGEDEIESKWRFYKNLIFLDENMKPRENSKKYNGPRDPSIAEIDYTHSYQGNAMDDNMHFHPMVTTGNYSQNSMVLVGTHLPREPHENLPPYRKSPELNTEALVDSNEAHSSVSCNNSVACKNEDSLFGELVGNMMQQIPAGQKKDFLKLEIQQLIIKSKYSTDP